MDWLGPEGTQTAKVMAGGGFGAAVLIYLRHPGTLCRGAGMIGIGLGCAALFGETLAGLTGLGEVQAGAVLGLVAKAVAEGLLRAVERFDFAALIPIKKGKDKA